MQLWNILPRLVKKSERRRERFTHIIHVLSKNGVHVSKTADARTRNLWSKIFNLWKFKPYLKSFFIPMLLVKATTMQWNRTVQLQSNKKQINKNVWKSPCTSAMIARVTVCSCETSTSGWCLVRRRIPWIPSHFISLIWTKKKRENFTRSISSEIKGNFQSQIVIHVSIGKTYQSSVFARYFIASRRAFSGLLKGCRSSKLISQHWAEVLPADAAWCRLISDGSSVTA